MSKLLFSDFKPVSAKAWKQKIQVDLKGESYNETLVWKTPEDINVKPFYHSDDKDYKKRLDVPSQPWNICQTIFVANEKRANTKALNTIKRGAESIHFIIPNTEVNIDTLLKDIDANTTPLYFELLFLETSFTEKLSNIPGCHCLIDTIGNLAKSGNWFKNIKSDHEQLAQIVNSKNNTLAVNLSLYQNAGATIVQQLAYSLAHANEYLTILKGDLKTEITFKVAVGSNYFFEIAKLRALRVLWRTLASEYNINTNCIILATPTKRNKTLYDSKTNMLRTTTECMSAILGGANTIINQPYDAIYHKNNEFGERISRNQLLILKRESNFDMVENASDGSYYIESLTLQLANKALELFKTIEANEGFLSQLKSGTLQKKIKESATKEQEAFNTGHSKLIGTNAHINNADRMKEDIELYPFLKMKTRKTLIEPILERRLAEAIEQNRIQTE